jgi:hypothetical protein
MGGGQANSGQASTAAAQQTAANTQDMQISAANAARQQQLTNTLFGNGSPGSTGTLSGMMNPANLTQTGLNPAYQAQFNQGLNTIGQSTAQQRGQLAQSFANSGATGNSTPTGFQADQMRQLGSSQADQQGQLYSGLIGKQYTDTLNNFWNANNIASGNAATAGSTATQSAGNSGTSSAQIYGTAGQPTPGALNSSIGAVGQVGAAAAGKGSKAAAAGCWIAEAIYGVDDPRTLLVREWLNSEFVKRPIGRAVMAVYLAIGKQVAWCVHRSSPLKACLQPLFERALRAARVWDTARAGSSRSGVQHFAMKGEVHG